MAKAKVWPDKKMFKVVSQQLAEGKPLSLEMVGSVFGQEFWVELVGTMLDANDAARAVAGAINRLKEESNRKVN